MKRILNYAQCYNFYQNLIGCKKYLKRYCEEFIMDEGKKGDKNSINSQKILDYGCGTGNIINFLPASSHYTGIDISLNYINYAKKKHPSAKFLCADLSKRFNLYEKFDTVICEAVLACISDENTNNVFENILSCTTKESKIIISDMNYSSSNSFFTNFMLKHERGQHLRGKEEYTNLISKYFKINNITIINNAYFIPYSKIVFECSHNMS